MLISKHTPEEQAVRDNQNREMLRLCTQIYIRQSFGLAKTTMEAESWITIAQEQGFIEMALEMQQDLNFELLTA